MFQRLSARLASAHALLTVVLLAGCSQQISRSVAPASSSATIGPQLSVLPDAQSAELSEQQPRLSTSIQLSTRTLVVDDPTNDRAVIVAATLPNHEDVQVTLTDAYLQLTIRGMGPDATVFPIGTPSCDGALSLAPGETIGLGAIILTAHAFNPGTYQFTASVAGYGYESPPAVMRAVLQAQ